MSITLPLDEMTVHEKLEAMELLWNDLVNSQPTIESPAWHEQVLLERTALVDGGQAEFIDWDKAKAGLRNRMK
jgi:hypothetical protein